MQGLSWRFSEREICLDVSLVDGKGVSLLMALSVLNVFVRSHGVYFWCLVETCDEVFDKLHAEEEVSKLPPWSSSLLFFLYRNMLSPAQGEPTLPVDLLRLRLCFFYVLVKVLE